MLASVLENLQTYCNHQIESFLYIGADLSDDTTFKFLGERIEQDKHKSGDHDSSSMVVGGPLFAANCKSALCVIGNRPSTAHFYL